MSQQLSRAVSSGASVVSSVAACAGSEPAPGAWLEDFDDRSCHSGHSALSVP